MQDCAGIGIMRGACRLCIDLVYYPSTMPQILVLLIEALMALGCLG